MSSDCVDAISSYLKGGDRAAFGDGKDPFKKFSGGGGTEGLAKALAADVDGVEDCPDGEERSAAMMFGLIVAGSKCLNPKDIVMIRVFMELVYEDYVTSFKTGMSLGKESSRADETSGGSHGGSIPSKAEADKILDEKGMRWQEVVAVTSVMHNGSVPSDSDIAQAGYGSDPSQWASAKEARKNGKPNLNYFLKAKDSKGYREMLVKGASRLAAHGGYGVAASNLMLFIQKLTHMTFDQQMPDLFLKYCEEHVEVHKGKGLASASNPLDMEVLTETVLAEKSRSSSDEMNKVVEQYQQQQLEAERDMKSKLGQISAMQSKLVELERKVAANPNPAAVGNKPPGPDNVCGYCQSPDHFIRDCPLKKAKDAKKKADELTTAI